MNHGTIPTPTEAATAFALHRTIENGHTFCWRRDDGYGEMFDNTDGAVYTTVLPQTTSPTGQSELIRVQQPTSDELVWEAEFDAEETVQTLFNLQYNLTEIQDDLPTDDGIVEAFESEWGLRLPNDPVFPTLIAFICSAQMSVPRIHAMQVDLAREFGESVSADGTTYYAFPTPNELASVSEEKLRELKLGYRAPYVQRTAELVAEGDHPQEFADLEYEEAHSRLKEYVGVGDKVADCVQLYALGQLDAFPVDTWIESILTDYYPHLLRDSYMDTADAAREYFGEYAGIAQAYLFAYARGE